MSHVGPPRGKTRRRVLSGCVDAAATARVIGRVLLISALLAGCGGRPLAEGERAFAADLFGDSFDPDAARIGRITGGVSATSQDAPTPMGEVVPRPGVCDRTAPNTGPGGPPPAFVLYEKMNVQPEFYRPDMMPGWPNDILVPESLLVAHEFVHIWQWQNRDLTGYRPARAAYENLANADPYFYVPGPGASFLEYGYEQQAALVEDYMCYLIFDPTASRRATVRAILEPYFQMDVLDAALGR